MAKLRAVAAALLLLSGAALGGAQEYGMDEDFADLADWEELIFPKIDRHSRYALVKEGEESVLEARSDRSASGLLFRETFDVYRWNRLSWRWKIDGVVEGADGRTKKGDDYAVRLYVIFEYDPASARGFRKAQYNLAKALYGEYPPDSGISYVWANRDWGEKAIPNAYSDRSWMIAMDLGETHKGRWREHSVDILADYRKAFGTDPPRRASVAIMADTDNTGGRSRAYIDDIRLSGSP